MNNEQYEAGEVVPVDICPISDDSEVDEITFAVSVEVYGGYGDAKHVYPNETVESTADLFSVDGGVAESVVSDNVRLYTVPAELLR
ncbi:hypothetical protein [Haloferax sp. DFSO52]|uniref:hypothetical protein n=1 Tax=Haloferax sp. DFSO52 TaxID=3388505 RepID=UPI003A84ABBF